MRTAEARSTATAARQQSSSFIQESGRGFFGRPAGAEPFFNKPLHSIQTKLTIGQPGDKFELEADAMADSVVQRLGGSAMQSGTDRVSDTVDQRLQKKCATCEEEENLQMKALQLKPIFESDASGPEDEIQRKCDSCEEEEKVRKKASGHEEEIPGLLTKSDQASQKSSGLESQLSGTRGSGSPLPETTRSTMESAFNTDFSHVNIHTGSQAKSMNKSLQAQAFTHGSDIYFNEGKYNPGTPAGQHLLAHELTHVVQQASGKSPSIKGSIGNISKKISNDDNVLIQRLAFKDLKYASPIYWNYRIAKWAGGKAWQGLKEVNKQLDSRTQSFLNAGKDDYFDIQGKSSFSPGLIQWLYILNYFERNRTNRVPFKIKYGNIGKGTIILEADNNYDFSTTGKYIINIDHPALKVDAKQKALAMEVNILKNKISGEIGMARGRTGEEMKNNKDMPFINFGGFNSDDLYGAILGEDYDGKNYKVFIYENYLSGGYIKFLVGGFLDIGHKHKILSILSIVHDKHSWVGEMDTTVKGMEDHKMTVERTPGGLLSADSEEMKLNSQWKEAGFTIDGSLNIIYINKKIEVYGTAKYKSKRAEGSVTIAVLPESRANKLFIQHVPAKHNEESSKSNEGEVTELPDDPLALTAWGDFHFKLIDKARTLSGDASFAVSPEGYVVTAGQIKLQKDFILMNELKKDYKLFEDEMSTRLSIGGVPVQLSLRGDIKAGYNIAPVTMYELTASGIYSNHPDYASELCLGAKFEMAANLYLQLNLIAAAGINVGYKYLSITFVEVGGRLSARADLNAYVNARPSIGLKKEKSGDPEYCLSGKLYAGGELVVSLDTGLEISVFRKIKSETGADEKKKIGQKDSFASWTIGDFGFELGVDYTLGSDKLPEFTYSGGKFDKAGFLRAIRRKGKTGPVPEPKLKGGFEQEGEQKGFVGHESFTDKDTDQGSQPLGPFELIEDFRMNGTPHRLFLTIGGTNDEPEVGLEMSSERDDLIKKVNDEIAFLEKINTSAWLIISGELTADQQKKIQMSINRLKRIREKAEKVKTSVSTKVDNPATPVDIAAPGFESLDDEIGDFGDQFGVNDLGDKTTGATGAGIPENIPVDKPPEGTDIILVLPPQKSIHLKLYNKMVKQGPLQHSMDRDERDTNQRSNWDDNLQSGMPRSTFCRGRGLGLTETDIFRPYWSKRYLDASRKSRKKPRTTPETGRMQVDHVIEWQVRPLSGAPWLDLPWNFELMDASSNASSGPKMKENILKERKRLAEKTGDDNWLTKDITFTVVKAEGSTSVERWSSNEIEDGDHIYIYQVLTGEVNDPEKEKIC
jgi:hypothetical protein